LGGKFPSLDSSNGSTATGVIRSPVTWDEGDNKWTAAEVFLKSEKGYRGLQNPPLSPGQYRLNPKLFRVLPVSTNVESVRLGDSGQASLDLAPILEESVKAPRIEYKGND
jgi:hypothetical protein